MDSLYKTIDISYVMLFAHAKFYCHLTPGYVPKNTMHFCDDQGLSPATRDDRGTRSLPRMLSRLTEDRKEELD